MAAKQIVLPANRAFNSNGLALPGAKMYLYVSGTSTPASFYADGALSVPLGPVITANGAGRFNITAYQDELTPFRLITTDKNGVQLDDIDPFYFGISPDVATQGWVDDHYIDQAELDAALAAFGASQSANGIASGCGVSYIGALEFGLSAGSVYLDSALVSVSAQTLTLNAADATNPRIDVLYVDDTGTFGKVTGDPAAQPSQPAIDPSTQLYLTFVLVPALATSLSAITTETLYDEGTEWTATTSGTGFTIGSTNNPNSGTKDIEGTTVATNAYVRLVRSAAEAFGGDGNLLFSIRSKATWASKRTLTLRWRLAGVQVGTVVVVKHGVFGFDSSITGSYQKLVIPKSLFAVPAGSNVDELLIAAAGNTGTGVGFYLDPIQLQTNGGAIGSISSYITQNDADARYLKLTGGILSGDLTVPAEAYGSGWNGSNEVPTKNDVYDKIQTVVAANGGGDMLASNNLSDVASASTSRTNLGLGSAAVDDRATTAQVQAGTASKVVEPDKLVASAAPQSLTDGATVAWDMSLGYNAKVTIAGNRTLTVSNPVVGMTYCLGVLQDTTGSRTMTWPSSFDWGTTGAPTLTTTASKRDRITLFCTDASTPKFDAFLSGKGFG